MLEKGMGKGKALLEIHGARSESLSTLHSHSLTVPWLDRAWYKLLWAADCWRKDAAWLAGCFMASSPATVHWKNVKKHSALLTSSHLQPLSNTMHTDLQIHSRFIHPVRMSSEAQWIIAHVSNTAHECLFVVRYCPVVTRYYSTKYRGKWWNLCREQVAMKKICD